MILWKIQNWESKLFLLCSIHQNTLAHFSSSVKDSYLISWGKKTQLFQHMNRTNVIKKNNPEKKSYKLPEKGLVKKQIRGTIFVLNIESLLGNCVKKEYFFCSRLFWLILFIYLFIYWPKKRTWSKWAKIK